MMRWWSVGLLAGCATETAALEYARPAAPTDAPAGLHWQCDHGLEVSLANQQLLVRTNANGNWWLENGWQEPNGLHFYAYLRGARHRQDFGWEFIVPTTPGKDAVRRLYLSTVTSKGVARDKPTDLPLVEEPCWAPDGPTVTAAREQQLAPADILYHHAKRFASAAFTGAHHYQLRACWTGDERRTSDRVPSPLPGDAWRDGGKLHFAWLGGAGFTVESDSQTFQLEIGETGYVIEAGDPGALHAKVYPKPAARAAHPHDLTCEYAEAR